MKYFLTLALILTGFGASAASWYVRDGSSGSGTSWTDAADQLSSAETAAARGDTIWVADGTYTGVEFNTARSGATLITVKKATVAAHGTETGWSDAYGDGQAIFSDSFDITSSYWLIDGVNGSLSKTVGDYGFKFSDGVAFPINVYNASIAISNITISHMAATAPTADVEKIFVRTFNDTKNVHALTISHCYAYGYNNFTWGSSAGLVMDGWVHEYNIFLDLYCTSTWHGEQFNNNFSIISNWHIRYNWVEGLRSGSIQPTMIAGALNNDSGPYYIYGNVFKDLTFADGGICAVNNGYGPHDLSGAVYNNTFINCESSYGGVAIVGGAGNNSMTVANNLFVDMVVYESTSGAWATNSYYNCSVTPTDASGKLVLNVNPFVNQGSANLHWAYETNAGATLASTYNTDLDGVTRGADGNWDRGAFEYTSGTTNPPLITVVNLTGTNGVAIPTYTITTTGGTPLTYGASNLPSGLSLSGANITGTPLSASGQTNTVLLSATNWGGYALTNVMFSIGQSNAPDTTPPSVAITSPTNNTPTSSSTIAVSGTASDANLSAVNFTNVTTGVAVSLTGTTSWSGTATLQSGTNVLRVRAVDSSGNAASNSVSVVYTPTPSIPGRVTNLRVGKIKFQ